MEYQKLEEILNNNKYNYPILALIDDTVNTELLLISSIDQYRALGVFKDKSLDKLYKDLEDILQIDDLKVSALKGDDQEVNIDNVIGLDELSWDPLLDRTKELLNQYKEDESLDKRVNEELLKNFKNDISAGLLDNIYKNILNILIQNALELGITELMIIGDVIYEQGLSVVIEKDLPEEFNINLINL